MTVGKTRVFPMVTGPGNPIRLGVGGHGTASVRVRAEGRLAGNPKVRPFAFRRSWVRSGAPGGAPWRRRTYDSSRTAGVGTDSGG